MKIKVCIVNSDSFPSPEYIFIDLPALPHKGCIIYLTEDQDLKLIDQIVKDHDTAYKYDIYYGDYSGAFNWKWEKFKKTPLEELKFNANIGDFMYVEQVAFEPTLIDDQFQVVIEINK